mmetsp:Transcript_14956/g.25461  ORF Transcript_14956/g.25461 Transcript_14956/m.25461 type:complete len:130 (+) Transcript_14956:262-651(+)
MLDSQVVIDNKLNQLLESQEGGEHEQAIKHVIRICSQALVYGIAKCFQPQCLYKGITSYLFDSQTAQSHSSEPPTKLLLSVFTGGKAASSAVKFSKFYLIIDGPVAKQSGLSQLAMTKFFRLFMTSLRK